MDSLAQRIAEFRAVSSDERGEAWRKCAIVEEMRDCVGDPEVLDFLLELIVDEGECDMARIEVLKSFEIYEAPDPATHEKVAHQLARVLAMSSDVLVQQWAAIAISFSYAGHPEVFAVASALLEDQEAGADVRYGCLNGIKHLGPTVEVITLFRSLVDDPVLGKSVRRILGEMGQSDV